MAKIFLGKTEYEISRPKLRKWFELENLKENFITAAESKNREKLVQSLYDYTSAAVGFSVDVSLPWYEIANAYFVILDANRPAKDYPVLQGVTSKKRSTRDAWDYDGRLWYVWLHTIAKVYSGWSIEYISELDVDDGIALIQEILLDEQFKKEWEWGLTELAYKVDKNTGKAELRPLTRPAWMNIMSKDVARDIEKPRTVRMPAHFRPVGLLDVNEENNSADIG